MTRIFQSITVLSGCILLLGPPASATNTKPAKSEIRIEIVWHQAGSVRLQPNGILEFPRVPCSAGIYRFEIAQVPEPEVYIGETKNLCQRFQTYRTPGPSQQTNLRMNALLLARLRTRHSIAVFTMVVETPKTPTQWDINNKFHRVLLEHAAIVLEQRQKRHLINASSENVKSFR